MLSSHRRTLLDLVRSELSLRHLSRRERLALGAICFCTLALRSGGLAANSVADGGSRRNNSVDCFAGAQAYSFDAHRAHCCELGCVQSLPSHVGSNDSRLFAPSGIQPPSNQRILSF